MENSVLIAPGFWQWQCGLTRSHVLYLPAAGDLPGSFTWVEETALPDGEQGPSDVVETTQTLVEFVEQGPRSAPPVEIVEAILARVQAQDPVWLEPYRLQHPADAQDTVTAGGVLKQGANVCANAGWSFLLELVSTVVIEGVGGILMDA